MSDSPSQPSSASTDAGRRTYSDEALRALANERRRTTLRVLANASTPIDARTVARRVASREGDADADTDVVSSDRIERVHVSLHHVHLPMLADVGFASYDSNRGVVADTVEDPEQIPL